MVLLRVSDREIGDHICSIDELNDPCRRTMLMSMVTALYSSHTNNDRDYDGSAGEGGRYSKCLGRGRIWKDKGIDKIGAIAHGVYIIRFEDPNIRDNIVNGGYMFFDNKPVVMKPWDAHTDFKKKDITSVPIWIQIYGLDIKYWGERALFKIVKQIGDPLMTDSFTRNKERLLYPRVLVEVKLKQDFPEIISFTNELQQDIHLTVKYEWLPITCGKCQGLGHRSELCKKEGEVRQKWVVKKKEEGDGKVEKHPEVDEEGFIPVKHGKKVISEGTSVTTVSNNFQILRDTAKELEGQINGNRKGGGEPPQGNG
ncbi:uncharacterized protein LOC133795589 [Humulus lupulus]|uniref:uncharacterized protein LOC133795589 n=1 Tax=Humulus lupulus TaxID=3486 RepID=UPI002B4060CA|nr:uncharacterized protein LOC133795589 [Humulus lupulus]